MMMLQNGSVLTSFVFQWTAVGRAFAMKGSRKSERFLCCKPFIVMMKSTMVMCAILIGDGFGGLDSKKEARPCRNATASFVLRTNPRQTDQIPGLPADPPVASALTNEGHPP
jgi:hypothetical protein